MKRSFDRMPRAAPMLPAFLMMVLLADALGAGVPEAGPLQTNLDKLRDRVEFFRGQFPTTPLPLQFDAGGLAAIGAQIASTPKSAAEQLKVLSAMLDRLELPLVKRKVYEVGLTVKSDPTNRGNVAPRRTLLIEFAEVLKRMGISIISYYPKGETYFVPAIRLEAEEVYPIIDEHLTCVSSRLKADMEANQGGGGSGGGEGGDSGGSGGGADEGGGGDYPDSPAQPDSGGRPRHVPFHAQDEWSIPKIVLLLALALLAVGTMAALILPRLRTSMGGVVGRLAKGKPAKPPMHEDQVKRAMAALHRGEYRKASVILEKIQDCGRADVAFYLTYCYVRLMEREKARTHLGRLPLDRLEADDLLRLANACEEAKLFGDAIHLLEWLQGRDTGNRTLAAKLELVREEAKKEPQ